jgi:hypothetical protein
MRKIIRKCLSFIPWINTFLLLRNVLKSNKKKNVLVSYISKPFESKNSNFSHTNIKEAQAIVSILNDLDYKIDIIDYNFKLNLDFSKYDLIFGFGETFEESFFDSNFNGKRIYYATGAHVNHQNIAEIRRVIEFNKVKNVKLIPKRIIPWTWSMSTNLCDALIVIGNSWTSSTYKIYYDLPVFEINASGAFQNFPVLPFRDIDKTRKSFLWFGGSGLIHKGLDICLDFFSKHSEFNLHICGPKEDDFFKIYEKELQFANIHYHGFVNSESDFFKEIVIQCLFSIMPSCSEGQSTALLTTMGTGLIPIATKETGIDIEKYGFLLESISVNAINTIISKIETLSDDNLLELSEFTFKEIHKLHSIDNFKKSLKKIISNII